MDKPTPKRKPRTVQGTIRTMTSLLREQTDADCVIVGWTFTRNGKSLVRFVCNGAPLTGYALAEAVGEGLSDRVYGKASKNPDVDGLTEPTDPPDELPEPPTSPSK